MEKIRINKKGFTLIEIILTLALLSIIIGVAYSIHFSGNKSFKVSRDLGFAQQDARIISEYLNRELKYSSKISKDDYEEGRYYSIELRDNDDGTKTLTKTEYEDDGTTSETKLLSKDWENIKIELEHEQGNRTIKGLITIKLNNNTDFKLPITVPLENIGEVSELPDILLGKVYYVLPEDILIADTGNGENTPGNGESGSIDDDESGDNGNGEDDPGGPEYPQWNSKTEYQVGDVITYNNKNYISIHKKNSNRTPGANNSSNWWKLLEQ